MLEIAVSLLITARVEQEFDRYHGNSEVTDRKDGSKAETVIRRNKSGQLHHREVSGGNQTKQIEVQVEGLCCHLTRAGPLIEVGRDRGADAFSQRVEKRPSNAGRSSQGHDASQRDAKK